MWNNYAPLLSRLLAEATPLLVYQIIVSVFVAFAAVNAACDWVTFRRPSRPRTRDLEAGRVKENVTQWPSVSVLIPARDEEAVLERCVASIAAQRYPGSLEILILDDHSSDHTGFVAEGLAARDPRIKALKGGDLLPGWKGKPNALRQLAAQATGDLLLLTDADCFFYRGALEASVRFREQRGADCLSLMPYLECRGFWEQVIVPLQYFLVFVTLPIRNVYANKNPAFAAANGAFLLLPRALYEEIGGHEAVRAEMAEDIKFAQYVKRRGYRLVYGDGTRTYSVRMYDSLRGIWEGFSKNLYPAMGKNPLVLFIWALFLAATQILPFVFVAAALARHPYSPGLFWLPLGHVTVALAIRVALSLRFRQQVWASVTHPLGWIITIAIAVNSAYLTYSRKGHAWKGRVYQT